MFKTAGEGFGDLAFATYNGDFNDPWLAANAVDDEVNRGMDGAAQDYLALSEDPSLAFDVAVNDTTDWFLDKLRSPENIGKLASDVFLTLAPSAKGFAGAEADAQGVKTGTQLVLIRWAMKTSCGRVSWSSESLQPMRRIGKPRAMSMVKTKTKR